MEKKKNPTSYRLSDTAMRLLAELSRQLNINQTAVLELAIREKAKREHITKERERE